MEMQKSFANLLEHFKRRMYMKSYRELPEGYSELLKVDLQNNKKLMIFVNVLALLITVLMVVPMHFAVPITTLFSLEKGILAYFFRFGVLLVLIIVYMILHELVHGITMKACGTQKVKYGFAGIYAFAGSSDYYDKRSYILIALAPVVLWGAVLSVILPFVSFEWFWVVYFIQIMNISGAAGDFYVTFKFIKLPKDILVSDSGTAMTVYSK
jgi:hypothetical protein